MKSVLSPDRVFYAVCLLAIGAAFGTPACAQSAGQATTNSIGMEFVLIPAGTFAMGADDNDPEATAS